MKKLNGNEKVAESWRSYYEEHKPDSSSVDDWEESYLPADRKEQGKLAIPKYPLILDFSHITRRIAAQRSRFILVGQDYTWLQEQAKVGKTIKRIRIVGKHARQLRVELRDSGITESVIYPDLDGLGREMKQLWSDWDHQPIDD